MIRQVPIRGFDKNLSYLISDDTSKELFIVDPGDSEQLIAEVEYLGLNPVGILLTHSHFDHFEGAFGLVEKYGIPVFVHKKGIETIQKTGLFVLEMKNKFLLNDTEILAFHTPGHTQDSVCFYVPKNEALLTGDTMFVGSVGKVKSVSDMKNLYSSISMIRKLPPKTIIFPGHHYGNRPASIISRERKQNEFLKARNFFVFSKLFVV